MFIWGRGDIFSPVIYLTKIDQSAVTIDGSNTLVYIYFESDYILGQFFLVVLGFCLPGWLVTWFQRNHN